jgi:hypothetical protein
VVTIEILRGMKGGARESIAFTVPGGRSDGTERDSRGAEFLPGRFGGVFPDCQGRAFAGHDGLTQGIYRVQRDAASGRCW